MQHFKDNSPEAIREFNRRYAPAITATVTFRDGRTLTATVPAHHWKSNLMRLAPYNADWFGCVWSKPERAA